MSRGGSPTPQIFEPGYYQRLYEVEESHGWARGMRDAMMALLRQPMLERSPLRVLDAGCGTGYLLELLHRQGQTAGEPVGIDLSPHALTFCRRRGARRLALASAVELPFGDDAFDLVISIDVLQHLRAGADRRSLLEMARVLAPGGVLYLRTNSSWGHRRLRGADEHLYRRYDLRAVAALLDATDLTVERSTHLNALPSLWTILKQYFPGRIPTSPPAGPGLALRPHPPGLAWLGRLLHGVLQMEAAWVGRLGRDLPFGHSIAVVARKGKRIGTAGRRAG